MKAKLSANTHAMPHILIILYKIYEMKISGAYFHLAAAAYIKMEIDVQYRNKYD